MPGRGPNGVFRDACCRWTALTISRFWTRWRDRKPKLTRVAVIFNPDTTLPTFFNAAIEAAAPSFGMSVRLAPVHDDAAIEDAIAAEASEPGGGLICSRMASSGARPGACRAIPIHRR